MLNDDFSRAFKILTSPIFNLIFSIVFAAAFLYSPARDSLTPIFGPYVLRTVVLAEFMAAVLVAIKMGLTGKLMYNTFSAFSVKMLLVTLAVLILIFSMIDQIFVFFILALIFLVVDIYAIESQEKYFHGNIYIVVLIFAAFLYQFTGSVAGIILFFIQLALGSTDRKVEPYDWLTLFLYFVIPVTFYSSGGLSLLRIWIGFYFIFKSMAILLEIFGINMFYVGEKIRNIFSLRSGKGKYFWSSGEEMLFIIILASPIFFRFMLGLDPQSITLSWLVIMFTFVAGSLVFIDPDWWKKYHKYKTKLRKKL